MSGLRERFQRMKRCEYWVIAYRRRKENRTVPEDVSGFRLLPQKRFITQADPFLFTHQGKTWLFYERQDLTDMKGTLWCLNLDDPKGRPLLVLEEPFHLSYPQVFRYGKYTYMLPETRQGGEVRLYRCACFPGKWERVEQILPLEAVDTTLVRAGEGRSGESHAYYAFTYTDKRLELYYLELAADRFHVVSKVKIYASLPSRESRPGGGIYTEGGKLYRPAQNCTDYYGQELILYAIDRLDKDGFQEHEACRLRPEQFSVPGVNAIGIHTYNRNEHYEVIDLLHREERLCTIGKKIEWKLRGMGK